MTTPKVVVGVNGSPAGAAAVRWAAAEAHRRRADLYVVAAYEWRVPGRRFPRRSDLLRTAEERAAVVLDAAVLQARSAAPDVRLHGAAVVGRPVPVLLEAAADAGLLVVGGRAVAARRPMLGTVTSQIATYAPGPVVIVREGWTSNGKPIVVGIDDSPSPGAVGAAFEQAASSPSATLRVVTAGELHPHQRVSDELHRWQEKHPEVSVVREVVPDDPCTALESRSHDAGLLVVGAGSIGSTGAVRSNAWICDFSSTHNTTAR